MSEIIKEGSRDILNLFGFCKKECCIFFVAVVSFFLISLPAWAEKKTAPQAARVCNAQIVGTVHDTRGRWNPFLPENDMILDENKGLYSRVFYLSPKGGRNADGIYAIRFFTNHDINQVFKQQKVGRLVTGDSACRANNIIFRVKKEGSYLIRFDPKNMSYNISPRVEELMKIDSMQLNGFVYDDQGSIEWSDGKRTYPAEKWDETLRSHDMVHNGDGTWWKRIFLSAKGGHEKGGVYQFFFSANHIADWGYCAINGQPGKLCGGSGYDSKTGTFSDSAIIFKVMEDGEYTFTINPVEFWYTISPFVDSLNHLNTFQVNGFVVNDPWNPAAKEHE